MPLSPVSPSTSMYSETSGRSPSEAPIGREKCLYLRTGGPRTVLERSEDLLSPLPRSGSGFARWSFSSSAGRWSSVGFSHSDEFLTWGGRGAGGRAGFSDWSPRLRSYEGGFPLRLGGSLQHVRLFFFPKKKADPRALFGAYFCAKLTQPGGRGGNVIRI